MPISAQNRKRYPKDWGVRSHRIRFMRAGGRCECRGECGADHDAENKRARWSPSSDLPRCMAKHGEAHPVTHSVVVLTTAHLDHTPENCGDENLKAMCQRCHLRYDRDHHKANSSKTRRDRKAAADLFDSEEI